MTKSPRTGKYRIIFQSDEGGKYFWSLSKDWTSEVSRSQVYDWEEKWSMKILPRGGIWEEIPWAE